MSIILAKLTLADLSSILTSRSRPLHSRESGGLGTTTVLSSSSKKNILLDFFQPLHIASTQLIDQHVEE